MLDRFPSTCLKATSNGHQEIKKRSIFILHDGGEIATVWNLTSDTDFPELRSFAMQPNTPKMTKEEQDHLYSLGKNTTTNVLEIIGLQSTMLMPSIDHPSFDITATHVNMAQRISAILQLHDNVPLSEDSDVFDEHSWLTVTQDSVEGQSNLPNSGDAQRYIQDVQDDKFLSVAHISRIIYDDDVSLEYMMLQQHEVCFVTFDCREKVRLVAEEHLTLDPGGAFHSNVCLTTEEHPALNSGGVSHMNAIFLETTHFAMFMNLMIHLQVVCPYRWINYKSHDILRGEL
jgi:hypothetical protein